MSYYRTAEEQGERRITKKSKTEVKIGNSRIHFDADQIEVSDEPLVTSGPVALKIPAKTFRWNFGPDDLEKVLRPYIHETIEGLPSHHFIEVNPEIDSEGEMHGISITVVVPEKQ